MLKTSKIILLIFVLLLPEYFIFESPYRLTYVAMSFLLLVYVIDKFVILGEDLNISRDTRVILFYAFSLLLYVFISDVIKNDPAEGARMLLPNLLIPLMLPIFEYKKSSVNLYKAFFAIFSISVAFAVVQAVGFKWNLPILFPGFGFLKSDRFLDPMMHLHWRVSGATFSVIGFALYLGIAIIILYYLMIEKKNKFLIIPLFILVIVLFFTQSRSTLYGIVPTLALTNLICTKNSIKSLINTTLTTILIIIAIYSFSEIIKASTPRVTNPFDASVIERLQTNYYATLGTWETAPIFGVPRDKIWDVIQTTATRKGIVVGDKWRITTTHHNQLLYYFRYYGLIGLGLLVLLYYKIFVEIFKTSDKTNRMILLAIFIFDFQYSMMHNNKLINSILLWVLLSLASNRYPQEDKINKPVPVPDSREYSHTFRNG
ncbi:MAG: hypothetical protein JXB42_11845 [Deltaproteobacteria bacterium]|nr:hypothetical protein [Deltaproteobacteria bacterium]